MQIAFRLHTLNPIDFRFATGGDSIGEILELYGNRILNTTWEVIFAFIVADMRQKFLEQCFIADSFATARRKSRLEVQAAFAAVKSSVTDTVPGSPHRPRSTER